MTPEREKHLIQLARTTSSLAETRAFREELQKQGETPTTDLLRAITDQIEVQARREGRR